MTLDGPMPCAPVFTAQGFDMHISFSKFHLVRNWKLYRRLQHRKTGTGNFLVFRPLIFSIPSIF
ncbi:unnamed protein product [Prunus brigantina]